MRTGYAYNWFDIGPAFPGLGRTFGVGPAAWGLLVAAFLVGAGVAQLPAGLLARRFGNRPVALLGAAVLAAAATGGALAPTFVDLLVARLIAGVGAGLFFSPAIGLVGGLYPAGRRGFAVGTFSSAFSLGAGLGILGTTLLVPVIDWRAALALGGLLLGGLTALAVFAVPGGAPVPPRSVPAYGERWPVALRLPGVWAIGAAFVGFEGATFATGQFIVPYGESVAGWGTALAGAVGLAFVLPSVAGGPIGGEVAERRGNHRTQLAAVTVAGAVGLAFLPIAGWAAAIAIGSVFSFAYGFAYAVMYVVPHQWRELPASEIPLAIGLFNGIQLAGGAGVAFLFGLTVGGASYAAAWEVAAAAQVLTLVALFALPRAQDGGPRFGAAARRL